MTRRFGDTKRLGWMLKRGLVRLHWPGLAGAGLLILAAGFALFALQPARQQLHILETQRADLSARDKAQAQRPEPPTQRSQLANFYGFFPVTAAVPDLLGKIQRAAQRNDLTLAKGEYKLTQERDFRLSSYQITLPVIGSYAQVRGFVNDVLDAVPAAALEELTLKREAVHDDALEARVRFTLFLGRE